MCSEQEIEDAVEKKGCPTSLRFWELGGVYLELFNLAPP